MINISSQAYVIIRWNGKECLHVQIKSVKSPYDI